MFCVSELRGLGDVCRKLDEVGGTVLAISSDSVKDCKQVVSKQKLAFDLLSDADTATIKTFGLFHHEPWVDKDSAIPANFLVNAQGKVVWRHVASRVQDRVDPAQMIEAVNKLLKTR